MSNIKRITLTRDTLARAIKKEAGLNIKAASSIVDRTIDIISRELAHGTEVKLRLFGSFYVKQKKERIGRNPKTMEPAIIGPRKVVKLKVAPTLKKKINTYIYYSAAE
jgi:integration host factor subunit alpha